jgi:hypothetical protein
VSDPRELLREQLDQVVIPDNLASAMSELGYTATEGGMVECVDAYIRLVILAMKYAEHGVPSELRM